MPAITIHDLKEQSSSLAFDLSDLFQIAGRAGMESTWRCDVTQCISYGDDAADHVLYDAFRAAGELVGADFAGVVARTRQVIDGTFWASHPERGRNWLRLKAIDSSFWEVEASLPEYLEPFRAHFRDVRGSNRGGGAA